MSSSSDQRVARVLIVDDSALMRSLLKEVLSSDPGLEVVGAACDAMKAWEMVQRLRPDVLTLDVEMPGMNGLSFLERLMRAHPTPVVMVSTLTERGAQTTLRALELGAVDFVAKPKIDVARGVVDVGGELVRKVKAAASARLRKRPGGPIEPAPVGQGPKRPPATGPNGTAPLGSIVSSSAKPCGRVIAIGASTGGTEALRDVLTAMPADVPPIVIVQHMPEGFTRPFAERLDGLCRLRVREAKNGDRLEQGLALIAPGGAQQMEVVRCGEGYSVRLVSAPPVNHHRPSVDVLFHSCARVLGASGVAAILTGMGGDGAQGMLAMRRAGARTVAQDEATCVVFGMPREAIACGAADVVVPLDVVASTVLRIAREPVSRGAARPAARLASR